MEPAGGALTRIYGDSGFANSLLLHSRGAGRAGNIPAHVACVIGCESSIVAARHVNFVAKVSLKSLALNTPCRAGAYVAKCRHELT